jgi:hypothetical protein
MIQRAGCEPVERDTVYNRIAAIVVQLCVEWSVVARFILRQWRCHKSLQNLSETSKLRRESR